MIFESSEAIEAYLKQHHDFGECILEDVRWRHFGTVIDLVFDYIWTAAGTVRPEYMPPALKTISLHGVQELHIHNSLSEYMSLHPNELNWGLSEVSSVRVINNEQLLARYRSLPLPLHHLRLNWEGERRIDAVFGTMEVE